MHARSRPLAALAALLVAVAPAARAEAPVLQLPQSRFAFADRWSLGLMLGAPTGVVLKHHLGNGQAWDVGVGALYSPGLRLHGDWLWTLAAFPAGNDLSFRFQLGAGALAGVLAGPCGFYGKFDTCDSKPYLGARVPLVLEGWVKTAPVVFGIELAPGLAFAADRWGGIVDGLLFVRFLIG